MWLVTDGDIQKEDYVQYSFLRNFPCSQKEARLTVPDALSYQSPANLLSGVSLLLDL